MFGISGRNTLVDVATNSKGRKFRTRHKCMSTWIAQQSLWKDAAASGRDRCSGDGASILGRRESRRRNCGSNSYESLLGRSTYAVTRLNITHTERLHAKVHKCIICCCTRTAVYIIPSLDIRQPALLSPIHGVEMRSQNCEYVDADSVYSTAAT